MLTNECHFCLEQRNKNLVANDNIHLGVALHETRDVSAGLTYDLYAGEAFEHFIPEDL